MVSINGYAAGYVNYLFLELLIVVRSHSNINVIFLFVLEDLPQAVCQSMFSSVWKAYFGHIDDLKGEHVLLLLALIHRDNGKSTFFRANNKKELL